jgi:hypothetical protein
LFKIGSNSRKDKQANTPKSTAREAVITILLKSFFLLIGRSFIFSCRNSKSLAVSGNTSLFCKTYVSLLS